MIFNTTGGGNTKPNLRVIVCTVQPENPSENTFWARIGSETPKEWSNYVFSSKEPLDPYDGLLWFKTGLSSYYAFPPVKDAGIYIYPNVCYRYVDTDWIEIPVNVYMHGEWCDMKYSHLYLPGHEPPSENECMQITGGWRCISVPYSGGVGLVAPLNKTLEYMSISLNPDLMGSDASIGTTVATREKVDLTNYSKLVFVGSYVEFATNANAWYGAWSKLVGGTYQENVGAVTKVTANNSDNVVVDISGLTGEYFVGVGLRSSKVTIKECYLIV